MTIKEEEHDFRLKLRLMRYLWNLGYFVRRNVGIVELWEGGKSYTDIDVLGVRLDEELNTTFIVCDCKSGATAKTRERMFWLSGIMNYFRAERGIFLRTKMLSTRYIELANRLGISPLSEPQLAELENSYGIRNGNFVSSFSEDQSKIENIFNLLKSFDPKVHDYIKTDYWEDTPSSQINNLVSCCKRIKEMKELEENPRQFLIVYSLSELALSILRFCKDVLVIPNTEKEEFIRLSLLGGKLKHEERKNLLDGFYSFMVKEIQERYHQKYPVSKSEFITSFVPDYSKYFVDLVLRICENPSSFIHIPRLLDLIAHEQILKGADVNVQQIVNNWTYLDPNILRKPLTDLISFAERSKLLTEELSKSIDEKITKVTSK